MHDVSKKPVITVSKLTLTVLVTVCSVLIISISAYIGMNFYNHQTAVSVVETQIHALVKGDYENAYILTSHDFQKTVPFEAFKEFVDEYPTLHANTNQLITSSNINENTGTVKITLSSKNGESNKFEFTLRKEDGEWMIYNIRLKANDAGVYSSKQLSKNPAGKMANGSSINLPNKFTNKDGGYVIQYPGNWEYQQPDPATVIIGGKQGTKSHDPTVNIQTVLTKESGGKYSSPKELIENLKKQAHELTKNTHFYIEDSISLDERPDRPAMKGLYTELTFTNNGKKYQQLVFVFMRPDHKLFYIWSFTSPVFMFNTDYPVAKAMFTSWQVK